MTCSTCREISVSSSSVACFMHEWKGVISLARQMNLAVDWRLLVLIAVANAMPIVGKDVLGLRYAVPLDGRLNFVDGQRLFGRAKTLRGIFLALVVTAIISPIVGIAWKIGLLIAAAAMIGDLLSSFLKRRVGLPESSMAVGLDQIPESLFPMVVCPFFFPLTAVDIACVVIAFFLGELVLSRLLHKLHMRDEPY